MRIAWGQIKKMSCVGFDASTLSSDIGIPSSTTWMMMLTLSAPLDTWAVAYRRFCRASGRQRRSWD